MAEKAHADDDVAFKGESFLNLKELVLEAGATAEGYDFELADHRLMLSSICFYATRHHFESRPRFRELFSTNGRIFGSFSLF